MARLAVSAALLATGAASGSGTPPAHDPAHCAGFTVTDAAQVLGVASTSLKPSQVRSHAGMELCSWSTADGARMVAFSVKTAASAKEAARDMEQYRNNLELAAEQPPWKGKLPKGAWSEIFGVGGDEVVWTDVNGSLTARRGKVTVQVTSPRPKLEQLKVAEILLRRL
jgi:hypothetical protein